MPSILFILTDDQPKDTMMAMPNVRSRIAEAGVACNNMYGSQSLCCPSRASILRGQYPHNTGIQRNGPPNGGEEDFRASGLDQDTVATRLRAAGYETGLCGKYLNGYGAEYKPPGWSYFFGRADPSTGGQKIRENDTVTDYASDPRNINDIVRDKALAFIDRRTQAGTPFCLFFTSTQPHLEAGGYADRYADMYTTAELPSKPSFDEANVSDKPQWVKNLPRLTAQNKQTLTGWRRNQLRSVRQVDDAVGDMLDLLQSRGQLDNTYVFVMADNSTHMGEHRYFNHHGAKNAPYEEAANLLFYVRGPGIPRGMVSNELVLNHDLAPTFEAIAGATIPAYTDGRSLLPALKGTAGEASLRTAILNEADVNDLSPLPPYHAVMTKTQTYVEWETGERELYGRISDPYQLNNSYDPNNPLTTLAQRLQALKTCSGAGCREAEDGM